MNEEIFPRSLSEIINHQKIKTNGKQRRNFK